MSERRDMTNKECFRLGSLLVRYDKVLEKIEINRALFS